MRWQTLAVCVAALVVAPVVGLALAGPSAAEPPFGGPHRGGPPGPGGPPDRFIEEHADRLGLNDETRQAIEAIVDESRGRAKDLHEELRGLHRHMHELLSEEVPDETAVMGQAEAIGKIETELHKHRLGTLIEIRALLTPEQRMELMRIRKESRHGWMEPVIESCEADLEQFCSEAGDRWGRRRCLREHWDDLSAGCRDAIETAKREAPEGSRRRHGRHGMGDF